MDQTEGTLRTDREQATAPRVVDAGVATTAPTVQQQTQLIAPRDRVRWGPIFAGFLTALGTFLLLSLLAVAIGATAVGSGADAQSTTQTGSIVTAILGLLSFLIGGFVAARTAAVTGRGNGLLNGFLVWALGTSLILLLAAFGLGQIFGAAGDLFGQYRNLGSPTSVDVNRAQLATGIKNGAFTAFLALALPAVAAAIGGALGAREHRDELTDDLR